MRHRKQGKKFNRKTGRRRSFLRNLVNDVIVKGKIHTTVIRAKAIKPIIERAVTIAKKETLASRRILFSRLQNKASVEKLMREWGPKYAKRNGGYLRIVKESKTRKRDSAPTAVIEFV